MKVEIVNQRDFRNIALLGRRSIEYRRSQGHDVSEAHSAAHLKNVAQLSQVVGDIYEFSPREQLLVFSAAWFHDFVRHPSEDPFLRDEYASAKGAVRVLSEMDGRGILSIGLDEILAVEYAVAHHDTRPGFFDRDWEREQTPIHLRDRLHLALFVADKMEANGVRVIARRASFVAGDRLKSEDGDLRKLGFAADRDEALVVALESIIRLSLISPERMYPERLKPLVGPLYATQREFVLGLCKSLGLSVTHLAEKLLEPREDGRNMLQVRNILEGGSNKDRLIASIYLMGEITDEGIQDTADDTAQSAFEAVGYFSSHYQENLEELMSNWAPHGEAAKRWQREMAEYVDGTWFDTIRTG